MYYNKYINILIYYNKYIKMYIKKKYIYIYIYIYIEAIYLDL